jgi:hypothetical protein
LLWRKGGAKMQCFKGEHFKAEADELIQDLIFDIISKMKNETPANAKLLAETVAILYDRIYRAQNITI